VSTKHEPCHTGARHGAVCERGGIGCTVNHTWHALQRIERKLDLLIKEEHMAQSELDAALETLKADVDANTSAVSDLITKVEAGATAADLTAEIQAVRDASSALESSHASAEAVAPGATVDPGTSATDTTPTDQTPA